MNFYYDHLNIFVYFQLHLVLFEPFLVEGLGGQAGVVIYLSDLQVGRWLRWVFFEKLIN